MIDVSQVTKRNFSNYLQEQFKPKKEKEIRFFNEQSITSKESKQDKFTNFLYEDTDILILERIMSFLSDITMLKDLNSTTVSFKNDEKAERISNIIKLYISDFEISSKDEDRIRKAPIVSRLNTNENVRVYFMINDNFDTYEIILIDPFHLVIPSDYKKKKAKQVLNETYNANQYNGECISSLMKKNEVCKLEEETAKKQHVSDKNSNARKHI